MTRQIDAAGLQLVKSEELCAQAFTDGHGQTKFRTYDDRQPQKILAVDDKPLGTLTIGYGHTGARATIGAVITEAEATGLLGEDLALAEKAVTESITATLTDNQFAALVDLAFNIGPAAFRRASLVQQANRGHYDKVPAIIGLYRKSKGVVMTGLVRRRAKENLLWSTPDAVESFKPAVEASLTPDPLPRLSVSNSVATVGSAVSVAGGAIVAYAPGVATTLQQASQQLQPLSGYDPYFRYALEVATVLGGVAAVFVTACNLRRHSV